MIRLLVADWWKKKKSLVEIYERIITRGKELSSQMNISVHPVQQLVKGTFSLTLALMVNSCFLHLADKQTENTDVARFIIQ